MLGDARQKLATYLLESPSDMVLKMVQAGVSLRASRIDFELTRRRWLCRLAGVSSNTEQLMRLLVPFLQGGGWKGGGWHHFALAFNTALFTSPQGLRLAYWDGQEGYRFDWTGSKYRRSALSARAETEVSLEMVHRPGSVWEWAWQLLQPRSSAEARLLRQRARWCPVPVQVNGRPLPPPVLGPMDPHYQREGFEARIERSWWLPGSGLRRHDENSQCGGLLAVGRQPEIGQVRSSITFVLDGVETPPHLLGGRPGGEFEWMVMPAHGLNTDISGLRLVLDDLFRQRIDEAYAQLSRQRGGAFLT
ncbi:MAG: hypothetical protein U0931_26745 [Vulcanimicrobiota bacterium]